MKIDSWTGGLEEAGTVREALALTPSRGPPAPRVRRDARRARSQL
jgi:hypothetical protein